MGLAAAIVVTVATLTTIVVVPALLRLAGKRVLPRSERKQVPRSAEADISVGRRARGVAHAVARRPGVVTAATTLALLALASPALGLALGQPDDGNRPVGDTMRTADDRLTDAYGPGFNGPLVVAVDLADSPSPAWLTRRAGPSAAPAH